MVASLYVRIELPLGPQSCRPDRELNPGSAVEEERVIVVLSCSMPKWSVVMVSSKKPKSLAATAQQEFLSPSSSCLGEADVVPDDRMLLDALPVMCAGDFSKGVPSGHGGLRGEIADTINAIFAANR